MEVIPVDNEPEQNPDEVSEEWDDSPSDETETSEPSDDVFDGNFEVRGDSEVTPELRVKAHKAGYNLKRSDEGWVAKKKL